MFSRREKALLVLAALAVVVVVGAQFLGGAGTAKADPSTDVAHWQAMRQRVDDTQARLRGITTPAPEAAAQLLRAAQASALATGVSVTSARPRRAAKTSAGCLEQALETQAAGPFPSIARFMFDIEAKNPNLRIARVAITSSDSGSDKVNCVLTIVGYSPGEPETRKVKKK